MKMLFDTTFLLPLFGIKVDVIDVDRLIALRESLRERGIGVAYPKLLIIELIAKIAKEASKLGEMPLKVLDAFEALLSEVDVELVEPSIKHVATAIEMRIQGHKDVFDNILYAMALHENMRLLTEDKKLIDFLRDKGYRTDIIIRLKDLERILADKQ